MNVYRRELRTALDALQVTRPAVLRRSLREDYLYSTDLPQAADRDVVRRFSDAVRRRGWRTETEGVWIHLDPADIRIWPDYENRIPVCKESICCLSILQRHSPRLSASDGSTERLLIKAAEEGRESYEKTCRRIHGEWAAALREHRRIPDVDPRFLGGEQSC